MTHHAGLEFAAQTDAGLVRPNNEDSVAISPSYGFAVLADGMGGYNAGEVASRIATSVFKTVLEEGGDRLQQQSELRLSRNRQIHPLVIEAVQRANSAILAAAEAEPQYHGMGTTLVAALFHHDKVTIAHVGDSRAYRLRQGELVQLTRDHSLLQEQIDAGLVNPEWAHLSQNRNLVTRAVGVAPDMEVEIHDHYTEMGDIYLLCSDGLSDMLTIEEIVYPLTDCYSSLKAACNALVRQANDNGGYDNIAAILIMVHCHIVEADGLFGRIVRWVKQGRMKS